MADGRDLTPTRELSRVLFGGQYRIEVGAAIAESRGMVCMVDLVSLLGDPPGKSSVNAELKILERAKLLSRPTVRRDRRVDLIRTESPYWKLCLELRGATAKTEPRRRRASRTE